MRRSVGSALLRAAVVHMLWLVLLVPLALLSAWVAGGSEGMTNAGYALIQATPILPLVAVETLVPNLALAMILFFIPRQWTLALRGGIFVLGAAVFWFFVVPLLFPQQPSVPVTDQMKAAVGGGLYGLGLLLASRRDA
jgi:hypothetical protein